jgi:hypothetical protein
MVASSARKISKPPRRSPGRRRPAARTEAERLLQKWIDTYGDTRDPDLEQQMEDLRRSRIALRGSC